MITTPYDVSFVKMEQLETVSCGRSILLAESMALFRCLPTSKATLSLGSCQASYPGNTWIRIPTKVLQRRNK